VAEHPTPQLRPCRGYTETRLIRLLRHSIATILLDSGLVPIDQVQKFLGHLNLSTTQIYAETSLRALGENYPRVPGGKQ
jgi:site-specific recombinase XerD